MSTKTLRPLSSALASVAPLLQYPREDFIVSLNAAIAELKLLYPQASRPLIEFKCKVIDLSPEELEEIYTRTFDLAPLCIPYLSSYIYGDENYERGTLMSRLSERYQECNFDMQGELPDHIALILSFAPHCEESELDELIEFCLAKALATMTDSLKENENLYYLVLKTAQEIIEAGRKE